MRFKFPSPEAVRKSLPNSIVTALPWFAAVILLLVTPAQIVCAQNTPVISGGIGFLDSTNAGANFFQPVVAPVVVVPFLKFLFESRFDLREFYIQRNGGYQGTFVGSTQYLQLDYFASPHVTVTGGRFLTPFGTYNERLTAIWIPNFQDAPLIFPIGTRTTGSSDGGMLRGVAFSKPSVQMNYVGYFSASSNVSQFESARSAGGRIEFYFPGKRVEIGASYARFLQDTNNNSVGAHFWWMPWCSPLQVRSEYAHGRGAQGYWLEAAYRLSQWTGADSVLGRLEPAFRMQQTFRNSPSPGDSLPAANTQQADFGLDYNFPHEVRLNSSYSRQFSRTGNANIWDVSLTYRFLLPMWRGRE
jgi:hypothetical protein